MNKELCVTLWKFKNLFASSKGLQMKGQEGPQLPGPLNLIRLLPAPKTSDLLNFGKDGVTRRMMLTYQDNKVLQPTIAALVNPDVADIKNIRGVFDFIETDQAYIDFQPAGTYPRMEFSQAMTSQFSTGRYKNKIVLVGQDLGISDDE